MTARGCSRTLTTLIAARARTCPATCARRGWPVWLCVRRGALQPYISEEGEALAVGRGKAQIFGYGALLYLLEAVAGRSGTGELLAAASRALFLSHAFPPRTTDRFHWRWRRRSHPTPGRLIAPLPGWHDYNRYADYLPFLGVYLLKAAEARA